MKTTAKKHLRKNNFMNRILLIQTVCVIHTVAMQSEERIPSKLITNIFRWCSKPTYQKPDISDIQHSTSPIDESKIKPSSIDDIKLRTEEGKFVDYHNILTF